jgi:hypothetical protein
VTLIDDTGFAGAWAETLWARSARPRHAKENRVIMGKLAEAGGRESRTKAAETLCSETDENARTFEADLKAIIPVFLIYSRSDSPGITTTTPHSE